MKRTNISSGTIWEKTLGYSRAVRIGPHVAIASTAAINRKGQLVGIGSAYEQTKYILEKISNIIASSGGNIHHIIRTRIYLKNIGLWHEVGKAHQEHFGSVRPATTVLQAGDLVMEESLVEIEADAVIYGEDIIEESTEVVDDE